MTEKRYTILADPKGSAWEFAKSVFDELCKRSDQFEMNEININRYTSTEIKPKIVNNIRKKEVFFIHDSNKPASEWFLELCLVNQALKNSSAAEITNILPYLRFSRQDRKDESRVPISARVVADCVQQYADRVLTIDVHNPSVQGFYSIPCDNLYSFPTVINYLRKNHPDILKDIVVMSTDAGGAPRAKFFAKRLGVDNVAIGYKHRAPNGGSVETLKILGEIEGKNILIVDDLVDSGGTLIKAVQAARAQGANKIYGYCTHGLFTDGIDKVVNVFDKFFIGNTLKTQSHEKLEVISFVDLISEAIYRTTQGESLSQLFD